MYKVMKFGMLLYGTILLHDLWRFMLFEDFPVQVPSVYK